MLVESHFINYIIETRRVDFSGYRNYTNKSDLISLLSANPLVFFSLPYLCIFPHLSFAPVNIHRDRQTIANSFSATLSALSFSQSSPPPNPLISVGSSRINRQFQSSPAWFTVYCGQWPAYHTHTEGIEVAHTLLLRQRSRGGHVVQPCLCSTPSWKEGEKNLILHAHKYVYI